MTNHLRNDVGTREEFAKQNATQDTSVKFPRVRLLLRNGMDYMEKEVRNFVCYEQER